MRVSQLIEQTRLPLTRHAGDDAAVFTDVTDDSRLAAAGTLLLCRETAAGGDARALVTDAVRRGANAVVIDDARLEAARAAIADAAASLGVTLLATPRLNQPEAGELAEAFFGRPSQKLKAVGITGTNGKTTTAWLVRHLLRAAGRKPALIGTVETDLGEPGGPTPAELTTPGAVELARLLRRAVDAGCDGLVMEVSSHALDQGRVDAIDFDAAVFTNLTQDHLDYHNTMEDYAAAKARLFAGLNPSAWAVVNADDPWAARMLHDCPAKVLGTSLNPPPDESEPGPQTNPFRGRAWVEPIEMAADRSLARFNGPWGSLELSVPLAGAHNLHNAQQALAAASCLVNLDRQQAAALANVPPVPGRLEPVPSVRFPVDGFDPRSGPTVLIDYAHTPDALDNVLQALRPLVRPGGRLLVVFGCGGDRDRTKRPRMMTVACAHADRVVLTSDNPRSEPPRAILDDALAGRPGGFAEVAVVEDRAEAIARCVLDAAADDTLLIAGKGHEDYQIIGNEKRDFDDRREAAEALRRWLRQRGGVRA